MGMAVSRDNSLALTVSADHLVGRYNLLVRHLLSKNYITDLLSNHRQPKGPKIQMGASLRIAPNNLATAPSSYAMMAVYVQWVDGMAGGYSIH
jgi:hypothetical protein